MQLKPKKFDPFDWESLNPKPVIGVDEAGRGCLAGRVYAGAVILKSQDGISEYTDSKLLSESRREKLFEHILKHHQVGIGFASVDEIDSINILKAALLAMKRAVENLGTGLGGHVLIDGNQKIPNLIGFTQTTLVKGDLRAAPVAAASIIAKVSRDRYMSTLAAQYPQYDFEKHKGYSTAAHKQKIVEYGPCREHRKTFSGVKEFISPQLELR